MGCALATRNAHACVYALGETTRNVGTRFGSLRSALSSAGSYQAPKYHIKTMLRARYFASRSDGVLLLSSSSNCNALMIASSRSDAFRFFLTSCSRFSSADGYVSLAHVKYSRFTSTGSEPGTDFARSMGGAGTVGGFVGRGSSLNPGASLFAAMRLGDKTKATDLKDKDTVKELQEALGKKFETAWIKVGIVNGWVASSYHIKVAARDQSAFWLSSGNWQSSNQPPPPIDPLKKPWDRSWLSRYNREWHAIVKHPGLTTLFQNYIQNDFDNNVRVGTAEAFVLPDLLIPEEAFAVTAAEKAAKFQYFEPLDEERVFDVQPLLTPDNFLDFVLPMVNSAKEELYIQNQTFNAPGDNQNKLKELLSAVLAKQKAGVKVRIIFRILNQADARANLEGLQDFGFDMADVRVQKNCHTKGVIVDRQRVLIGSQNWSEQGISLNRDASLLFEDAKLAEYFAKIFEHDWDNLASGSIDGAPEVELAPSAEASQPGYAKISGEAYVESP